MIVIDKPNVTQQNKYEQFTVGYPYLFQNNQVFELETETLEEYYPVPFKRQAGEVQNSQKVAYARDVGKAITQEQFEQEMPRLFGALQRAGKLGFAVGI